MEVDGKEFLRNVGIEQDKERLAQEQKRLEALKREAFLREEAQNSSNVEDAAFVDLSLNSAPSTEKPSIESTIEDIKLEQKDQTYHTFHLKLLPHHLPYASHESISPLASYQLLQPFQPLQHDPHHYALNQ
jgi:hypothetical protein